jgi:hypothetical protein
MGSAAGVSVAEVVGFDPEDVVGELDGAGVLLPPQPAMLKTNVAASMIAKSFFIMNPPFFYQIDHHMQNSCMCLCLI